ncbi:MAG: glycosyltransferase, partial [Planctomycetota bacterium]
LIPYPYAARRHQDANAEVLSREGAAEVLDSASVTAGDVAGVIERLVKDGERREQMAAKAAALGRPGAADEVAALVCGLLDAA